MVFATRGVPGRGCELARFFGAIDEQTCHVGVSDVHFQWESRGQSFPSHDAIAARPPEVLQESRQYKNRIEQSSFAQSLVAGRGLAQEFGDGLLPGVSAELF